jgi:cytochrome c-type biogenesis protein
MAQLEITILVAFGAGVLSFLSPCVLPLVPAYLGHLMGVSAPGEPRRTSVVIIHSLAFVSGFSLVFVGIWASVGLIGYILQDAVPVLRRVGGAVIIVMGLHVSGVWRIPFLYREQRLDWQPSRNRSLPKSFLLGVLFAAGWTPCIGPILAGIIGLASLSETVLRGAYLLVAYSVGLGVPFVASAWLWTAAFKRMPSLGRYNLLVSVLSGALLVIVGLLMLTDTLGRLAQYLPWSLG